MPLARRVIDRRRISQPRILKSLEAEETRFALLLLVLRAKEWRRHQLGQALRNLLNVRRGYAPHLVRRLPRTVGGAHVRSLPVALLAGTAAVADGLALGANQLARSGAAVLAPPPLDGERGRGGSRAFAGRRWR